MYAKLEIQASIKDNCFTSSKPIITKIETLKRRLITENYMISQMSKHTTMLENKNEKLENDILEIKEMNVTLYKEKVVLDKENLELIQKKENLEKQLHDINEINIKLKKDNNNLEKEKDREFLKSVKITKEINDLKDEIYKIQQEKNEESVKCIKLNQENEELVIRIYELEKEKEDLEIEITHITNKLIREKMLYSIIPMRVIVIIILLYIYSCIIF